MKNHFNDKDYKNKLAQNLQLLYKMCGEYDKKLIEKTFRRAKLQDCVRMMIISTAFDFKNIFLAILAQTESRSEKIIEQLSLVEKDYATVKRWVDTFIDGIKDPILREVAQEMWREKQERFSEKDYSFSKLF